MWQDDPAGSAAPGGGGGRAGVRAAGEPAERSEGVTRRGSLRCMETMRITERATTWNDT